MLLLESFSRMTLSDMADVLVVSMLLFIALRIVHRHINRRLLFALVGMVVLYFAARTYHWQLTLRIIELVAFSCSVGAILLFQEDIRRFLESSLFSIFSRKTAHDESHTLFQVLLASVATFSKNHVGALIALEQKVPIDRFARGGHKLNGEVSFPLLCSIFDVHSIGHDGAVVIRGSRVSRFGVHLPLSRNHQSTGRTGTRHAASLGLSELTDAFVIVVSEETGEIGIARNGSFVHVTLDELGHHLLQLKEDEQGITVWGRTFAYLQRTFVTKVISFAAALVLWVLFIAPGAQQQRTVFMPLTIDGVPSDMLVDSHSATEVKVTLAGSAESFANWAKERQAIHVSMDGVAPGERRISLTPANLSLETGMRVTQFEPSYVALTVYRSHKVKVPVVLRMNGRTPTEVATKLRIHPKEVTLLVREGDPGPTMISTEPIDTAARKKGDVFEAKLISPDNTYLTSDTPPSVRVVVE